MSRLLVNEYPLLVAPTLAAKIGLNEAIMLQQIHFWIIHPKSVKKNGRSWHYETYDKWLLQFPFWSLSTVKRISKSLCDKKLVIAEALSSNKSDRTLWYTVNYEQLNKIELTVICG